MYYSLDLSNLALALEMLGKYSITTGSSLMFAYTAEPLPNSAQKHSNGDKQYCFQNWKLHCPFIVKSG